MRPSRKLQNTLRLTAALFGPAFAPELGGEELPATEQSVSDQMQHIVQTNIDLLYDFAKKWKKVSSDDDSKLIMIHGVANLMNQKKKQLSVLHGVEVGNFLSMMHPVLVGVRDCENALPEKAGEPFDITEPWRRLKAALNQFQRFLEAHK